MATQRKLFSDMQMMKLWGEAWDASPCTNPYSVKIDRALREKGLSIHDVKTRVGIIRGKKVGDRLDTEQRFLDFADSLIFLAEQSMVDKCTETTQGAIFLLESKYGYRKGTDLNITANADVVKTVRQWGKEPEKPVEGQAEAV